MEYSNLNEDDKKKYNAIAEKMFGKTVVFSQSGEPLYFDEKANRIPVEVPVMDALKMLNNKN